MAVATLISGLERTSFIGPAAGVTAAANDSSAAGSASGFLAAATSPATLDTDVEHARVDSWVTRLTTSLRGDFEQSLDRMARYESMITRKIDEKGMPRELIYLAMIESNFNPTAKSRVKAVGMWQFMSGTARQFGLSVGRGVDERKDPAKSTDADFFRILPKLPKETQEYVPKLIASARVGRERAKYGM